jgi:hypothetical protein
VAEEWDSVAALVSACAVSNAVSNGRQAWIEEAIYSGSAEVTNTLDYDRNTRWSVSEGHLLADSGRFRQAGAGSVMDDDYHIRHPAPRCHGRGRKRATWRGPSGPSSAQPTMWWPSTATADAAPPLTLPSRSGAAAPTRHTIATRSG